MKPFLNYCAGQRASGLDLRTGVMKKLAKREYRQSAFPKMLLTRRRKRRCTVDEYKHHTGSLWLDLFQNSRNIAFAKIWHILALAALKDSKKPIKCWKRPTKSVKVILKARESKNGKILILLHLCDHLVSKMKRIQYFDVSRS